MENKGFEASVDYSKRINNDWSVSFRGTFTYSLQCADKTVLDAWHAAVFADHGLVLVVDKAVAVEVTVLDVADHHCGSEVLLRAVVYLFL